MAPELGPDSVLRRAPEVALRLHANGQVSVAVEGVVTLVGPHALAVLDAFSGRVAFSEALRALQARATGVHDFVDLTTTVQQLYELGALYEDRPRSEPAPMKRFAFDDPRIHVKMLNDRPRTQSFLSAIQEVVRDGDIVVDLGTGTGVLAAAAAQAGARHVYAIEAGGIGSVAQALFEANGLTDQITLVEGWSSRVTLPEAADVLVTETIGSEPLGEQILESIHDARQRLLKKEARLIPGYVRVLVLPVTVPGEELAAQSFSQGAVKRWQSWYGMDFDALLGSDPHFCYVKPGRTGGWATFSEPLEMADLDLSQFKGFKSEGTAEFLATRAGELNGILVFFELQLSPTTTFSLHPDHVGEGSSWRHPVWILGRPLEVATGDRFSVSYSYRSWPQERLSITRI